MHFRDLNLHPALLEALDTLGYEHPTPIQARAIPEVLAGRDLLGCAQTGTGKTAAFALPILQRLAATPRKHNPRCLVLVPTRELAAQVAQSFNDYGKKLGVRVALVIGGVSQGPQVQAVKRGVDVLVAAPGRLLDLMQQRLVSTKDVEVLVLDEADRMLDMGFIEPIRRIIATLPRQRQNLLFSATMPQPIRALAAQILRHPAEVAVTPVASTVDAIEQRVYHVPQNGKLDVLFDLLDAGDAHRVIVFVRTKHGCDRLVRRLDKGGVPDAAAIHGNKSQSQRTRALDGFKRGAVRVLVATDVASRGIDVEQVSHVINYDLPNEPEAYVHRIGRTGRAGQVGVAISLVDHSERGYLRDIERLIERPIPVAGGAAPARGDAALRQRSPALHATRPQLAPPPRSYSGPAGTRPAHRRGHHRRGPFRVQPGR